MKHCGISLAVWKNGRGLASALTLGRGGGTVKHCGRSLAVWNGRGLASALTLGRGGGTGEALWEISGCLEERSRAGRRSYLESRWRDGQSTVGDLWLYRRMIEGWPALLPWVAVAGLVSIVGYLWLYGTIEGWPVLLPWVVVASMAKHWGRSLAVWKNDRGLARALTLGRGGGTGKALWEISGWESERGRSSVNTHQHMSSRAAFTCHCMLLTLFPTVSRTRDTCFLHVLIEVFLCEHTSTHFLN